MMNQQMVTDIVEIVDLEKHKLLIQLMKYRSQ